MTTTADDPWEGRVLVLAPAGRDAQLVRSVLGRASIDCEIYPDLAELRRNVVRGAGAVLLTEEGLSDRSSFEELLEVLRGQRPWSHLPFLVFTSRPAESVSSAVRELGDIGDVTLLDRPIRRVTLVSAVRSALRSRRRQFEVRDLLEELQRGVRDRDRFLAILGHELRNPLSAIQTAVERMEYVDPGAHSHEREVVLRQTRLLSRLVDDLLDVSRVTSGKVALRRTPVDLNELAKRVVESAARTAETKGVAIAPLPREAGTVYVEGDPDRLEQIVNNLLANAIKYTPSGGKVEVTIRAAEKDAELRVADTGVGIESEILPKVFDLFTQADSTLDRSQGGLGIGLTLVKSLVELHGGTVSVESPGRGAGSQFTVRLPRSTEPEIPTSPILAYDAGQTAPPRRILVIEDNGDVREGLRTLLEDVGHRVFAEEHGEEGIAKAIAEAPDAALIDIGLPDLDGYVVARRIRDALGDRIHLIAVTGYGTPDDRLRAREAGFDDHLSKPATLASIHSLLYDGRKLISPRSRV